MDQKTKTRCIQVGQADGPDKRDDNRVENDPGLFAAEQTWPTQDELKSA